MTRAQKLVVFSDLDGTLLDHSTYSFDAARPALDALAASGVPLVLASSKTGAEIRELQDRMGLTGAPAIVENGAGIAWTASEVATDDDAYKRLHAALAEMDEARDFKGFGDMSTAEVAAATGLSPDAASLARQRAHSEPGIWSGSKAALAAFVAALAAKGISARRGGRFLTLSFGRTKADAMAEVATRLGADRTLALGDAPNDAEMLAQADIGILVRNDHGPAMPPLPGEAEGRIRRTSLEGPAGWNEAVLGLLRDMGIERNMRHG